MKDLKNLDRRSFIKITAAAGMGAALSGVAQGASVFENKQLAGKGFLSPNSPLEKVKIGFVGVGMQGSSHVENFLRIDNIEIKAICDIIPAKVEKMQKMVIDAGHPKPAGYSDGETDFIRMCEKEDLDLVYTSTPWGWHVPVCVAAMENGKHSATEVPAALSIDDCWKLIETAEKYKKHCVMMENCTYGERELMVLNMVRQGIYGEIIHAECGYLHDLRKYKLGGLYEGDWRIQYSIKDNGNLYPTHGLGPVSNCMDINRGDYFDYIVSMSSNSRGLHLYAMETLGPENKYSKINYALGDVNVSLIKTKKGRTITVYHDTNLPRPYSRIDRVQGTRAISEGFPDRIYIEGKSPEHQWEPLENYKKEYNHELWNKIGELAKGAGHGGMDFLEDYRLVQSLLKGTPTDMDVYDAAALSSVYELSIRSVADKSRPVDFPDFTRGLWKDRKPENYL